MTPLSLDEQGAPLPSPELPGAARMWFGSAARAGHPPQASPWWSWTGGRPGFAARAWLAKAQHASAAGKPAWDACSSGEALRAAAALRLLASTLARARAGGPMGPERSRRFAEAIASLPVFFDKEFCQLWEGSKPWAAPAMGIGRQDREAIAAILASPRPSDAYQIDASGALRALWSAWLGKGGLAQAVGPILASARSIEAGESLRHASGAAGLPEFERTAALAAACSLDGPELAGWAAWALMRETSGPLSTAVDLAAEELRFDADATVEAVAEALGFGAGAARGWRSARLGPEGIRIRGSVPLGPGGLGAQNAWRAIGEADAEAAMPHRHAPKPGAGLAEPFLSPLCAAEGDWSWMDGAETWARALRAGGSVWICGPQGSGKGDLAAWLCAKSGQGAAKRPEGSGAKGLDRAIRWAKASGLALVEDGEGIGASEAASAAKGARKAGVPLVWTSSGGKDERAAARSFDFHAELDILPIAERKACAAGLFGEGDLSLRVAQAIRLPGEMAACARALRLGGRMDWEAVSHWIAASRGAAEAASGLAAARRVTRHAAAEEIVGCPELADLLDRAVESFERPGKAGGIRGILLMGPPGTGKTMFARCLAARARARAIAPDTSLLAKDPALIRKAFDDARALAPCILILDEADALVANPVTWASVNKGRQEAVNALIAQLDGMEPLEGVMVVATSHRRFEPDPAVIRSGRLSEVVRVKLPDRKSRQAIWSSLLEPSERLQGWEAHLSKASAGFSGAEMKAAAERARFESKGPLSLQALLAQCDRLFWGVAERSEISDNERLVTAVHEAGHAFAVWGAGMEVVRACARPGDGGYLGMVHFERGEERVSMTPSEWRQGLAISLAGIAAEKAIFGAYTNGGGSDLDHSTTSINSALRRWGWGAAGPVSVGADASERTLALLDEEAATIAKMVFAKTERWLADRAEALLDFAKELRDRRELSGPELDPWRARATELGGMEIGPAEDGADDEDAIHRVQTWDERPFGSALHRD